MDIGRVVLFLYSLIYLFIYLFILARDRDGIEAINTQNQNEANISRLRLTTSVNKRFIKLYFTMFGKRTTFSCGTQRVIPSRQNSAILPANQSAEFGSSYLQRDLTS